MHGQQNIKKIFYNVSCFSRKRIKACSSKAFTCFQSLLTIKAQTLIAISPLMSLILQAGGTIISATEGKINTKSFRWDGISIAVELTNTEENCCSSLGGCHRFVCFWIFKAHRCLELWVKHILDSFYTNSNFWFRNYTLQFQMRHESPNTFVAGNGIYD